MPSSSRATSEFPQLAGLDVAVQGDDYVVIDASGVHLTGLDVGIADAVVPAGRVRV